MAAVDAPVRQLVGVVSFDQPLPDSAVARLQRLLAGDRAGSAGFTQFSAGPRGCVLAGPQGAGFRVATHGDGSFLVLSGEVYNADELRGITPAEVTWTDAQILLHFIRHGGPAAMATINGPASFTLWDALKGEFLIARSRSGVPPMFYARNDGRLLWAQDIRSLLLAGIRRSINLPALDFFLAHGYIPSPWSLFSEISRVPPGHYLRVHGGSVRVEPYRHPVWRPKQRLSPEQVEERLRSLFARALRRRLAAATRIGVLLSGGVDSALVVAGLVNLAGASVDTFTFRYDQYEGIYNELDPARHVAQLFQTRHHEIVYAPEHIPDRLDRLILAYEEPPTYGLNAAQLAPVRDAGIRVLFTGSGSGGLAGLGPDVHHAARWASIPAPVIRAGRGLLHPLVGRSARVRRLDHILRLAGAPISRSYYSSPVTSPATRRALYADPDLYQVGRQGALDLIERRLRPLATESFRDRWTYLNVMLFDPDHMFHWHYRWGLLHGITHRHPFTDNDLEAFFFQQERPYWDKDDLRRFAATMMPREIAYRKKVHQTIPLGTWFRGPLKEFLYAALDSDVLSRDGLFRPETVRGLADQHVRGEADHTWALWALVAFHAWKRLFVESEIPRPQVAASYEH